MVGSRSVVRVALVLVVLAATLGLESPGNVLGQPAAQGSDLPLASLLDQAGTVPLPGHVSGLIARATAMPATAGDAAQPLTLVVVLRRGDEAGFQGFLRQAHDPRAPGFRRFARQPADL